MLRVLRVYICTSFHNKTMLRVCYV